jgi:hypothetical protein
MTSTQPKINDKILANDLLRLPSTGLKIRVALKNNRCSWGKELQNLFFEMIVKCWNVSGILHFFTTCHLKNCLQYVIKLSLCILYFKKLASYSIS